MTTQASRVYTPLL